MADPSLRIAQRLAHYRVLEQIGAGGMGLVFRAHDERLDRDVALKVLPPGTLTDENARRRFRKEALTLSKLNHPNIETVFDFDTQDGVDFLVMELIPGVTLDEKLQGGALPEKEVVRLGMQLTEGLAAAHAEGVIHRDLKPGNLRLTPDGRLKILDFGLAKLLRPVSDVAATDSLSQTHGAVGTLPYMAPEQLRGEPADARSDIWAAGTVLYEMASGRRPFPEREAPQLITSILRGCPQSPREIKPALSPRLEEIVLKCLDCDAGNRYQSVVEVAVDLRRLAAPSTAPVPRRVARRAWPRRFSLAAAGVGIVLAVVFYVNPGRWRDRVFATAPHIESLAVLPLQNLSGDPQQEYFADGMTDELITQIAQTSELRVTSRSSIMQYKKTNKTVPEIARELNVDAVLEGSVQRVGNRVRIQAQLIYAPKDQHLWAQHYDREISDVLGLQDEVAGAIAREVGGKLSGAQEARAERPRKVNPQAYEAYLRGRAESDLNQAIADFDQAIKLDPDFAPAYAEQANAYFFISFLGLLPPNQVFPKMGEAAAKAVEKDPLLAEGHAALALVRLNYDWDFPAAEREFRRALELNPSNADAHHMYAHYLLAMGKVDQSVEETRLAMRLDPAGEELLSCVAWHEISGRNYELAVSDSRRMLRVAPDDFWVHLLLGWTYEQQKLFPEATTELRKALELSGGAPMSQASLAHVLAASGKRQQARAILEKMRAEAQKSYVPAYDLAVLYLGLGDKNTALEWLQKASIERSVFLVYINWDPRFDVLRSDPRFVKVLKQIGLPVKSS